MLKGLVIAAGLLSTFSLANAQQGGSASATSSTQAPPTQSGSVSVEQNVEYGEASGQKLMLDVYLPANTSTHPRPGVVLIHGGGWTSFDKGTMRGMGQFLARSGFVAISVNYRLLQDKQNRWPAQLDDVQRSVRWLRANAGKYSVDPEHIGAFGHSAGAQLASLLGMEDTRDNSNAALSKYSSRVQAVVDASGPTDFTTERDPEKNGFLADLLGSGYREHPEVWRDASPAYHVSKDCAPFLIVHGTKDPQVPLAQAQELFDKLTAAGASVKLVTMDEGHTFTEPEARERLAIETLAFFHHYLGPTQ